MAYTRGSAEDFDRFARVTGDSGWDWDNLQQFIRKVYFAPIRVGFRLLNLGQNEHFMIPSNITDADAEFDPRDHSFNGINSVSLLSIHHALDSFVFQATNDSEVSQEFPFNRDMNSGMQLGIGM